MVLTCKENENTRIDIFLLLYNKNISRNTIANAIKKGLIKVNNIVIDKPSYKVKSSDVIEYEIENILKIINKLDSENVISKNMKLDIVFEDEDLLVINKPSGLTTHPSHGHIDDTLLNGVHFYLHPKGSENLYTRKHMVHRLDKDTSGLIAFAKSDKMLWWLHRQFAERKVEKTYYALVLCNRKYDVGEKFSISGYLERSRRDRKLYIYSNKYGKYSLTDFEIENNFCINSQYFSLVKCSPKTGRTHQIRVHLKTNNTPIWGDPLYSSSKQLDLAKAISIEKDIRLRLFLHSFRLKFVSFNGKEYDITAQLGNDLNRILAMLNEKY